MNIAFLNQTARVGKLNHLPYEQTLQQSRVFATAAGSLSSALAGVDQEEREGLPRNFGFVGFACSTLHCETPKIAGTADHMVADASYGQKLVTA